jgi:predicted Zn-dependent protease
MRSRPALLLALSLFAFGKASGEPPGGRPVPTGAATRHGQSDELATLERAAAASPSDVDILRKLAAAYDASGRRLDAVAAWRKLADLAPAVPGVWYSLGHAYNAVAQEAIRTFDERREDAPWRELLIADGLAANGHFTDAFALYRAALEQLPAMVSIHDSIARIYERTGHAAWAARERAQGVLPPAACADRAALCDFRAGRYEAVLAASARQPDAESRYWRARAATELALAAFTHLETLPDSPERRAVRATMARAEERHHDAVTEWKAALALAPGNPALTYDLASAYYATRAFEQVVATLAPLLRSRPDDARLLKLTGYSLLQLRRLDEAMPILQRAADRDPADPGPRLALARASVQSGSFAAAIPLLEPHLGEDQDGSLHVQLARAYAGVGQRQRAAALLARSQELNRQSEERHAAAARRTITPPK